MTCCCKKKKVQCLALRALPFPCRIWRVVRRVARGLDASVLIHPCFFGVCHVDWVTVITTDGRVFIVRDEINQWPRDR